MISFEHRVISEYKIKISNFFFGNAYTQTCRQALANALSLLGTYWNSLNSPAGDVLEEDMKYL